MAAEMNDHQDLLDSSSSTTPLRIYDVFLSFSGVDTRHTFVDHLYVGFLQAGVRAFRDEAIMTPGDSIRDVLLDAIQRSSVALVIFSENYTKSRWCLDELVDILECRRELGLRVISFFYQVTPSDIRQIARGNDLDTYHAGRVEPERLRQWKKAIAEAAELSGYDFGSDRPALIKYVAEEILGFVRRTVEPPRKEIPEEEVTLESWTDDYSSDSPSSLSSGCWNHDVFLSFSGKNTRRGFTSHLYTSLVKAGVRTYRDEERLRGGEQISSQLLMAIQESSISIIVFSKDYATSSWCLDELVKILQCRRRIGQLVLPVFYSVDPSDVRHQIGSLKEYFEQKRMQFPSWKLDLWKAALTEAANLSGSDYKNWQDESKLVEKIVQDVVRKVNPKMLPVATHPVGLKSRIEYVYSLLRTDTEVTRIIGIYGMGGLGKTALAKAVYNLSFHHFECSSFLADVRKFSEAPNGPNSLVYLQEQLLSINLIGMNLKVESVDHGTSLIKKSFSSKKVLFVIDDLDDVSQVRSIVERDSIRAGSRIILTTRDEHLLDQYGVDIKYEVKELDHSESLKLFCWHAFKKPNPPEEFVEVSHEMTTYAGGLPLALMVFGSELFGRTVDQCKSAFKQLRKIPANKIQEKLELSYESLGVGEQEIFLDVAFFFIGMNKDYVTDILDACGMSAEYGIRVLQDRSLLAVSKKNVLIMHDLLRDMGREIIRRQSPTKPGERSRLWSHEDISDVLRRNEGTEAIEGFSLVFPESKEIDLGAFSRMNRLKLLHISNAHLSGRYDHLSKELRWLCWRACPLEHLPTNLPVQYLVVLDMQHSKIGRLWSATLALEKLKILNLSHCYYLTATPDMSKVRMLKTLLLECCTSLSEIHPSIGVLERLLHLNLKGCKKLKSLPDSICMLRSLEILNLTDCSTLEHLPDCLGDVKELLLDGTTVKQLCTGQGVPRASSRVPSSFQFSFVSPFSFLCLSMFVVCYFSYRRSLR